MEDLIINKDNENLVLASDEVAKYLYLQDSNDNSITCKNLIIEDLEYPIEFSENLCIKGDIESSTTIIAKKIECDRDCYVVGQIYCISLSCNNLVVSGIKSLKNISANSVDTIFKNKIS